MAFLATNVIAATEYVRAKNLCVQIDNLAKRRSIALESGATAAEILSIYDNCLVYIDALNEVKTVNGILEYAQAQEDDPTYDIAAEFNSVISALEDIVLSIVTLLPKDVNDWLLVEKATTTGRESRTFTAGQVVPIKNLLDALDATIV